MHILVIEDNLYYREQLINVLHKQIAAIDSIRTAGSVGEAVEQIDSE